MHKLTTFANHRPEAACYAHDDRAQLVANSNFLKVQQAIRESAYHRIFEKI